MRLYDQSSSSVWILFALYICIESIRMPLGTLREPGPGFVPLISGILLGGLSLVCFLKAHLSASAETKAPQYSKVRWKNLILILTTLCVYTLFLEVLGFILDTFLLLILLFRSIEPQKWTVTIGGSALTSSVCYAVFELWLKSQLPKGILGF